MDFKLGDSVKISITKKRAWNLFLNGREGYIRAFFSDDSVAVQLTPTTGCEVKLENLTHSKKKFKNRMIGISHPSAQKYIKD